MFDLTYLLLSVQVSLLDFIAPQLRAVTVDFNEEKKMLIFHFYYDGVIDDRLFDLASCATLEADPRCEYEINDDIVTRIDYPQPLPLTGRLVYLRNEIGVDEYIKKKYEFESDLAIVKLLLYLQQSLLGKIKANLRSVSVGVNEIEIEFYFVFDGPISEEDKNLANKAIDEASKPFELDRINRHLKRIDYPHRIPSLGQRVAYFRYEDVSRYPD